MINIITTLIAIILYDAIKKIIKLIFFKNKKNQVQNLMENVFKVFSSYNDDNNHKDEFWGE